MPTSEQFQGLYSDHHGWLYDWLRRRLGNAWDAADIAHDAFLRLLTKPRDFDGFEGARAYLRTVANGLCIDLWRRRQIELAFLEALQAQPEMEAVSAEDHAAAIEALCEIDALLQRLAPKPARAFILAMVYGLTDREVAAQLGVSDRMVRKYVAQAMLHCLALESREGFSRPANRET